MASTDLPLVSGTKIAINIAARKDKLANMKTVPCIPRDSVKTGINCYGRNSLDYFFFFNSNIYAYPTFTAQVEINQSVDIRIMMAVLLIFCGIISDTTRNGRESSPTAARNSMKENPAMGTQLNDATGHPSIWK